MIPVQNTVSGVRSTLYVLDEKARTKCKGGERYAKEEFPKVREAFCF
jgi:hypothetical protein